MHTLLVTGPGGAGRTTAAAVTALAAARAGRRVLLLSGDPGDPMAALVGPAAGPPEDVAPGLRAVPAAGGVLVARIDSGEEFRAELVALQDRGAALLSMLGGRALGAEELTELPGAEQFALLRALRRAVTAPGIDLVVVDMPPLHQAVATLALPAQLRRYLARLLPAERQAARALRPVLAQLAGVPMPAQWLYEAAARWDEELAAVQAVIEAGSTAVRLVAEPGPAADAALRTGGLGLALQRLRVADVVANRTLPPAPPTRGWPVSPPSRRSTPPSGPPPACPSSRSRTSAATPGAPTTSPRSRTAPPRLRTPPGAAPTGPSRTGSPRTGCSSGWFLCPAPRSASST